VEKNKIEIKLEAEEDIKGSSIRGSLLIFRKDDWKAYFLDLKSGKRSEIESSKFSIGSK